MKFYYDHANDKIVTTADENPSEEVTKVVRPLERREAERRQMAVSKSAISFHIDIIRRNIEELERLVGIKK